MIKVYVESKNSADLVAVFHEQSDCDLFTDRLSEVLESDLFITESCHDSKMELDDIDKTWDHIAMLETRLKELGEKMNWLILKND